MECKQATPNPYGSMEFVHLKVCRLLIRVELTSMISQEPRLFQIRLPGLPAEASPQTHLGVMDEETIRLLSRQDMFVMVVGVVTRESKSKIYGLLLHSEDVERQIYMREGLVTWEEPQDGYINQILKEDRVITLE